MFYTASRSDRLKKNKCLPAGHHGQQDGQQRTTGGAGASGIRGGRVRRFIDAPAPRAANRASRAPRPARARSEPWRLVRRSLHPINRPAGPAGHHGRRDGQRRTTDGAGASGSRGGRVGRFIDAPAPRTASRTASIAPRTARARDKYHKIFLTSNG